jgi:hypothetical protein
MKQIFMIMMACAMTISLMAQEVPEATVAPEAPEAVEAPEAPEAPEAVEAPETAPGDTVNVIGRVEVIDAPDHTRVALGKNQVIIVEENGDTVIVGLGSKGISIREDDEGVEINVLDMEDYKPKKKCKKRFDPHWAGIEAGLNNYLTPDFSLVPPPGQEYMDLNTGRSWNWDLNIADIGVGLGTRYVGLCSGLGFEFINYIFDGQNNIMKDPVTTEIVEYVPDYAGNITKSKMNITYMTAPLLMEFQIPAGNRRIHLSGGVIGGLKLWSNTKIKYRESGDKAKENRKGDYNLSPLRWGVTARIGYGELTLFANYYMTSLFKTGRGPELYPFSVGIALTP